MSPSDHDAYSHPTVSELLGNTDLPNPTIPVPFERFAALKENDDMMVRAAFWCFYAAWLNDGVEEWAPNAARNVALGVEARHDGHQLRAITSELAIRDAVIVRRRDLHEMQHQMDAHRHRSGGIVCALLAIGVAVGVALGLFVGWLL